MQGFLHFCRATLLLAPFVTFVGCSSAPERADDAVSEAPLLQYAGDGVLWTSGVVRYCFATQGSSPVLEQRKREFREALAQSWGTENLVRFSEGACDSNTVQVTFRPVNTNNLGGQAGVGRFGALQLGMQLGSGYLERGDITGFKWVVAHEMGHVLGFSHEQDQPNSTCNEGRDASGTGISLTQYDPSSVMNYCAVPNEAAILSELDRQGFRRAYGNVSNPPNNQPPPPSNTPLPPGALTSERCEPSNDSIPGPAASQPGGPAISFRLLNQCPNGLLVSWLDPQGQEVADSAIGPGAEIQYSTYGGHRFRLRSATTRRFIVDIVMTNTNSSLTMPYR